MEAYLLDWLSLLLRWAHVIVGIAWIGASFYFIWLDNHLETSSDPKLAGDLWAIHGGGFYTVQKYKLAPSELPARLHWFKWEAYWTWITGFALLCVVYYHNADLYLLDPAVMILSKPWAIGIGLGSLVVSLAVYEGLCRSPVGRNEKVLAGALVVYAAVLAWCLNAVFSGRGAFMHFGAILGTIMAANVAHIIIPGQRRMVAAMQAGREPDPRDAWMGKQRSVHNTYFTLPVVFTMISGHYAFTFGHRGAWILLFAMAMAGALIRTWFVLRHKGRAPAWVLVLGLLFIAGAAALVMPRPKPPAASAVPFGEVNSIVQVRCAVCHAEKPGFPGLAEAPKGVKLERSDQIRTLAVQIHQQTVVSKAMPPGNITGLTEEERAKIDLWYRGGAN